jgi:hypothetical protein
MDLQLKNIPCIKISRRELDEWENMKVGQYFSLTAVETHYVNLSDLEVEAAYIKKGIASGTFWRGNLIWVGTAGFMSNSWVPKYSTKETGYDYRFGTGSYCSLKELLFVDDVFEWAHRRIDSGKVRTMFDIVWQMAGNTGFAPKSF